VGARPIIELLYFEGCPNHEEARMLVERVADEEGVTPDLHLAEVKSEDAEAKRFLGSPIEVEVERVEVEAATLPVGR